MLLSNKSKFGLGRDFILGGYCGEGEGNSGQSRRESIAVGRMFQP